jgi:hypothetical protein
VVGPANATAIEPAVATRSVTYAGAPVTLAF